jgi:signal transduction histidine kinase
MTEVHAPTVPTTTEQDSRPEFEVTEVVRQLSHELRQPLSTMESIAYYLSMVVPRHDLRVRQQVEKLQTLVDQMNWVLADAVHFFQATPPNPQLVDLNELVSETITSEQGAHTPMQVSLCESVAMVQMDPSQARHCVQSLIGLVRKWAHGEVRVSTRQVGSEVHLRVAAPQLRIQSDEASLIFEPFRPHAPAGAGLAFASVRRIAEANGGRAEVQLNEPKGVTVSVELPCAA